MKTLLQLANEMDRLAKKETNRANDIKKEVASAVLSDLVNNTAADVGEAVSNWQVSLGVPASEQIPAFVPSKRGRMVRGVWTHSVDPELTIAANAPIALEQGYKAIKAAVPGQPIFISNLTPQISQIDRGSSKQTPAGFVFRATVLGRSIIEKLKRIR